MDRNIVQWGKNVLFYWLLTLIEYKLGNKNKEALLLILCFLVSSSRLSFKSLSGLKAVLIVPKYISYIYSPAMHSLQVHCSAKPAGCCLIYFSLFQGFTRATLWMFGGSGLK